MKLKSIALEYDDGILKHINSESLDMKLISALAEAGLCDPPLEISSARHYLVFQWNDGWQEVLAVNSDVADLIRYYVIRRIEDRGRLALDVGADYPELQIIERRPADLSRLLIVGDSSVKAYSFRSELESYEGIFDSGGKREYKKYDRSQPQFKNEFNEISGGKTDIDNVVGDELNRKGMTANDLLRTDSGHRIREYQEIAQNIGLKGMQKQSDTFGLIELILKRSVSRA